MHITAFGNSPYVVKNSLVKRKHLAIFLSAEETSLRKKHPNSFCVYTESSFTLMKKKKIVSVKALKKHFPSGEPHQKWFYNRSMGFTKFFEGTALIKATI